MFIGIRQVVPKTTAESIIKTGKYKDKSFGNVLKRVLYKVVEVIGWVYTKIDYLVRDIQALKEDGGLFGKKKQKF